MPKISKGLARMPPNYLFKEIGGAKDSLKRDLKSRGEEDDIIAIGIGDPDIPTPGPITSTMKRWIEDYKGYPEYEGLPELREALAAYYHKRYNVGMPPQNIVIGDGAKSDLSHIPLAFANIGDKVVMQDPAYPVYLNWSSFFGLEVYKMPCTSENNFFGEIPKKALDDKLALIWICSPNNPTGAVASKDYLKQIVDYAIEHNAVVVHDIAYADFRPGTEAPDAPSIFSINGAQKVAVELGSFSKPYSMTGDRLSWFAARNEELVDVWNKIRSNLDSGVPEFIQRGGVTAIKSPEVAEIVRQNMAEYGVRVEILKKGFEDIGCTVYGLGHSPYAWIKVPEGYTSKEFSLKLLNEAHLVTAWGSGFGECGEGYIRATVFQKKDKIAEAMERIRGIFN